MQGQPGLDPLNNVTRKEIYEAYRLAGRPFIASTRSYESTVGLVLTAVDNVTPSGLLLAAEGTQLKFFSYQREAAVPGLPTAQSAKLDDTNIVKAQYTNAEEDFAIEGFSLTHRSSSVTYANADKPTYANAAAIEATSGAGPAVLYDPLKLAAPSILHDPLLGENALMAALQPHLFLTCQWDKRIEEIGCMDLVTEGGAKSYLRAMGKPSTADRYTFKEGFNWRREGTDSKFMAIATLARNVVIPYAWMQPVGQAAVKGVTRVIMHLKFRVHGVAFSYGSRN